MQLCLVVFILQGGCTFVLFVFSVRWLAAPEAEGSLPTAPQPSGSFIGPERS
jgi:hypothetical protein